MQPHFYHIAVNSLLGQPGRLEWLLTGSWAVSGNDLIYCVVIRERRALQKIPQSPLHRGLAVIRSLAGWQLLLLSPLLISPYT